MSLFHLSKNNRFGLEYPPLNERFQKFVQYISNLLELSFFTYELESYLDLSKELEDLIEINTNGDIMILFWGFDYYNRNLRLSEKKELLYVLDLFLKDYIKCGDFYKKFYGKSHDSELEDSLKELNRIRKKLLNSFELFDLDYRWSFENSRIERKTDEVNTAIINNNLEKIDADFNYQNCVDEFLKPRTKIDYLQSLDHLKRVFERVLNQKGVKGLSKINAIIDQLFPGKSQGDIPVIKNALEFIKLNIHHDEKATPYKFSENEYVYWWLEINKLIFMINSK